LALDPVPQSGPSPRYNPRDSHLVPLRHASRKRRGAAPTSWLSCA